MIQIIIFTILIVVIQNNPLENMNGIDYDLVRLLDTSQKNFLFRTVKPFNHTAFLYDDLVANMKRRALEEGFIWNDNLKVHVYSFLLNDSKIRDEHTPL